MISGFQRSEKCTKKIDFCIFFHKILVRELFHTLRNWQLVLHLGYLGSFQYNWIISSVKNDLIKISFHQNIFIYAICRNITSNIRRLVWYLLIKSWTQQKISFAWTKVLFNHNYTFSSKKCPLRGWNFGAFIKCLLRGYFFPCDSITLMEMYLVT